MTVGSAVAGVAVTTVAGWAMLRPAPDLVVPVPPGDDVGALAERWPGAVLELGPGHHPPFVLGSPATVRGGTGAVVGGGVEVRADEVRLEKVEVRGGRNGISVREADGVVLSGVTVRGAELHGIEVVDGSAHISGCLVDGLSSPFGQGIEVRNANGRPRTVVTGCRVGSGQEGIVSHVSRVEFVDNTVQGTTMRGIAVTEMSEGLVEGNAVTDAAGVGLLCGDMSHCEVVGNRVTGMAADGRGSRSHAGHALAATYYSTMRERDNRSAALAGRPVAVVTGSRLTDRFPLSHWPPGWRGALPAVPITVGALGGLALVRVGTGAVLRRRPAGPPATGPLSRASSVAVLAGFGVQAFHMLEHGVQVWQVNVAAAENRSGLAGARFDMEWVHFAFNLAVLAFLTQVWVLGRRQGWLAGAGRAPAWMAAALVVQGLHLAEHGVKLGQHLAQGLQTAPGALGRSFDLVWLHFGINVAVFAGTAVAVAVLVRHLVSRPQAAVGSASWARRASGSVTGWRHA